MRAILKSNNVVVPSYNEVRSYCDNLHVGTIIDIHSNNTPECPCMGVKTNLRETLQLIVSTEKLFKLFHFPTETQQEKLFGFLKRKDRNLYKNMDQSRRTIFIRDTGDNFRASAKMPTEQTS